MVLIIVNKEKEAHLECFVSSRQDRDIVFQDRFENATQIFIRIISLSVYHVLCSPSERKCVRARSPGSLCLCSIRRSLALPLCVTKLRGSNCE